MVLVSDDGWVPGSFFGVYHLKGLRAELRNGESGPQVCSLCGSKWEGKGHGGGGLHSGFRQAHQGHIPSQTYRG